MKENHFFWPSKEALVSLKRVDENGVLCSSKHGPEASSIGNTWELHGNAEF